MKTRHGCLALDEYIAGVIQCEIAGVTNSGPLEAQAIAARTIGAYGACKDI